jgi:hypothetical protein
MADTDLAKFLAPRQKRLKYWRMSFTPERIHAEKNKQIEEQLSTYAMLLAKLAGPCSEAEQAELQRKLLSLESELGRLFELSRYTTGPLARRNSSETPVLKP